MGRKALKTLGQNSLREPLFIGFQEYSRWGPEMVIFDLLVDRSVDRPTVIFLTVEPPIDRPRQIRLLVDRPVD